MHPLSRLVLAPQASAGEPRQLGLGAEKTQALACGRRIAAGPCHEAQKTLLVAVTQAAPEDGSGWLVTGAEHGPAHVALVVLGARQGQRLHDEEGALRVAARAGGSRQRLGPGQVAVEQSARELVGRARGQLAQLQHEVVRDLGQARPQLVLLFILVDSDAVLVTHAGVVRGAASIASSEGLQPHERGRHELRVRGHGETPWAEKGGCRFSLDLGPRCLVLHGT